MKKEIFEMQRRVFQFVMAMSIACLVVSCGGGGNEEASSAPPAPMRASGGELPEGHPPVGDPGDASVVPPPPGSGTGATGMAWTVPAGWVEEPPAGSLRRAQYRVPGAGGDGECVVFYFGPNQGGDPMSNASRWASQFKQPDGSDSMAVLKTKQIDVGGIPVLLVEVSGTYANLMVSDEEMPGYMLLGAIAQGPDANWFFKLTGPEATIREQRGSFDELAQSIRTGGS
jgi:hypothetical protein